MSSIYYELSLAVWAPKAIKKFPTVRPIKNARGYIAKTVKPSGLSMAPSASGHERTLLTKPCQNKKCFGVYLLKNILVIFL